MEHLEAAWSTCGQSLDGACGVLLRWESIDGAVNNSTTLQGLLGGENNGSLMTNAALAAGLVKLLDKLDGPAKAQVEKLLKGDS